MIATLLLLLLQVAAPTQPALSGMVVDARAPFLQPLFDARVELVSDSSSPLTLRTDANGRFVFSNVRAGRYRVSVSGQGFLRKTRTVTLVAGQPRNDIVIGLDAAPTIYGRIKDTNNVPIANILVEAIKVVYGPRGDRSVASVESALSDDRGEYHLYWLDSGDYYIRASALMPKPGVPVPANPLANSFNTFFAPTYYPGFRDPKDAATIHLRAGANLSAFDFRLQPTSTVDLWGNISSYGTGEGVGTLVTAMPAGAVASVQKFEGKSISPPDKNAGDFKLNGMFPGTFIVSAQFSQGSQKLTVHRKFTLKGTERAFILKLSPGSAVSGGIAAESGAALDLRSVRVALDSTDPDLPSPEIAAVDRDGQFAVARVEPGEYAIRMVNLPGEAYLKSAKSGDADTLSKPLRVEYGSPPIIRAVLGMDGSRLEGTVVDGAGRAVPDATVVLVPDLARRDAPELYRIETSGDDGRFTLHGIPPGEYKLFAWESIEPNAYLYSSYLGAYENRGTAFNVPASSSGTATVRVIPAD